jgi:hypothetical protein
MTMATSNDKQKRKHNTVHLFTTYDVQITARPVLTGVAALILVGFFGLIASLMGISDALLAGIFAMFVHYAGEIAHQIGHAIGARQTGYPMHSVEFCGVLGTSIYLQDEDDLAPAIHIRRAIGGGIMSCSLAIVLGVLWLFVSPTLPDWLSWVWGFAVIENFLVFGLGAYFPPIAFGDFKNDGATIRYYQKKMRDEI